jgi:ABC-type phosphonate transport system ATPase subunit
MASTLLQASNLCKSYGARRAVDGVSLRVAAGQTVGPTARANRPPSACCAGWSGPTPAKSCSMARR